VSAPAGAGLRWVAPLIAFCLATASPAPLGAQGKIPTRNMAIEWSGSAPALSFSVPDFVTPKVIKKLDSGLPQTLVTHIYAYPERGQKPIAVSIRSCRVVYDLWEGVYRVERQQASGQDSLLTPSRAKVVGACLDVGALALGDGPSFARHRGQRVYFAVLVELNPLSPETVQRIRRWLARSSSGPLEGEAFFGSFVSVFVGRRMGSAEHTLKFRTRSVTVPR